MAESDDPLKQMADDQSTAAKETQLDDLLAGIRQLKVSEFLLSTVSTIASISYGKLEAGDLVEAKLGIDTLRALLPLLDGHIEEGIRKDLTNAVANLGLAYVEVSAATTS